MKTDEVILRKQHISGIEHFEANEPGIAVLKAEFVAEAEKYLYLRKGEDFGGDIIGYMLACINSLPEDTLLQSLRDLVVFMTAADLVNKHYPQIAEMLSDLKERFKVKKWIRRPSNLRLLLWPDQRNEEARPLYEKQGYEVRHYQNEMEKGQHRMYINERRYCLFLRSGADRFVGFIGSDSETHTALKNRFEEEWNRARKP